MTDVPVMVFPLDTDDNGAQRPGDGVICCLFPEVIVDDRPRGAGPAVIELPDQGATTFAVLAPFTPPATVSVGHGFALCELGEICIRL